jgi:hypothetical protein
MRNGFYGAAPRVNASLLHEARMILTQLFGGRVDNYYSMRAAEAQAKAQEGTKLACALCLHIRVGKANPAITVIDGFAICEDHIGRVQSSKLSSMINQANG